MFNLRSIFSALLIALMLMTSGSMAAARGTMQDASGVMVLCTGQGTVTVLMGADGAPIEAAHICPDCAITVFADTQTPFELAAVKLEAKAVQSVVRGNQMIEVRLEGAAARGPPSV